MVVVEVNCSVIYLCKCNIYVVVHEQVGKEFPDMRQNEKEIKFIRVGEAVITAGWPKGELTLNRSLDYFYSQGTRSGIGVLWVIC